MTNEIPITKATSKRYDLGDRTAKFGVNIVSFVKKISENSVTRPLISQLVRAGTSVGANYCEADDDSTKKDFIYRIGICRKESKETRYWLGMIAACIPSLVTETKALSAEAQELNLIFSAILNRSKKHLD